jgi:hypothetical protein
MMTRKTFPLATFDIDPIKRIVSAEFTGCPKIDLEIAKELVRNRMETTDNQAFYIVIEFSNVREITPEAKHYLLAPEGGLQNILGAAFLANNPVSALIANIFIKSSKKFPSRYFATKEHAIQWILELQQSIMKKI